MKEWVGDEKLKYERQQHKWPVYDSTVKCSAQLPSTRLTRYEHRPVPAERHSSILPRAILCLTIAFDCRIACDATRRETLSSDASRDWLRRDVRPGREWWVVRRRTRRWRQRRRSTRRMPFLPPNQQHQSTEGTRLRSGKTHPKTQVVQNATVYLHTMLTNWPLSSNRQHLSYGGCLEVEAEYYQNCCVLCCVWQLCTTVCTQIWAVLQFMFS